MMHMLIGMVLAAPVVALILYRRHRRTLLRREIGGDHGMIRGTPLLGIIRRRGQGGLLK